MRILALLFALIGAAGSGLLGFGALDTIRKKEAELEKTGAEGARVQAKMNELEEYKNLKRAIYGMIAGVPLGVIGGYLALARKGKIAAVLLVLTYAVPLVILATGVGIDFSDTRVRPILLVPAGFLVAAFFALFIKSGVPYKAPPRRRDISEDDDLAG
jgi:hypothetical protein